MQEIFKDLKGFDGDYQISNLGNVKSFKRYKVSGVILKNCIDSTGYYVVKLTKRGGKPRTVSVHLLLAMTFLNHTPCGHKLVVDHIDNNPLNNDLSNLQIVTHRKNSTKDRNGGSSKYIGVSLYKGKWRSRIVIDGKQKHLGIFDSELVAHEVYQAELSKTNNK